MKSLEQHIDAVLRAQPLRRAPPGLESRVLQLLAQQSARPWWLRGFNHWPRSAQWLFVPLAAGLVPLLLRAGGPLSSLEQMADQSAPVGAAQTVLNSLVGLANAAQTLGAMVMREIPAAWIYGGVGLAALLYAMLFGLGAAAFRTLVMTPQHAQY